MQAFEILKVAIKEWVLVVPLYLKRNDTVLEPPDVINLM